MKRLSFYLALLSWTLVSGALIIAAFSMGYYNWWVIAIAVVAGFLIAWPSARLVARRIKENDPEWSVHRDAPRTGPVSRASEHKV